MGYAMGLLEGHSTAQSIDDAFANFNASNGYLQNAFLPAVLQKYLDVQRAWMEQQVIDGATEERRRGKQGRTHL
jgi:hypothetical protein